MKFNFKLKEIGLAVVLMGLSGFVFADLDSGGSGKAPEFTDPAGTVMSFNYEETGDDQASSGTCATNPSNGNNSAESYVEEPIVEPEPQATSFTEDAPPLLQSRAAPPTGANVRPNSREPLVEAPIALTDNPQEGNDPPTPTTPEPATLLIIGVSLAGFVPLVKRYRRKQTIR
ncbi:MAG: PEP-CTERM sorting domain-containing protein [Planctomycetaceae bacterium]|jgi:hypothetical protein|nr:PEP-CTERM sorting domain-containing protein [Planctomycetaceae bacterium]